MLTPDQITALRDASSQLVDPIVDFLIGDIAQRVSEAGQLTGTAAYQVWQAQKLGISQKRLKKEIQRRLKVSQEQAEQLLTQAAETGYDFDISRFPTADAIPFEDNTSLQQILDASVKLAQDDLTNITQTIGFITPAGKAVRLTEAYQQTCDFAFMKVTTGAQDYISAVREATRGLAEKGIQVIDYESGVHTSLEAAVRRNIMGGLGLMQEQISQQNHDDLGCDGWEISAHGGAAPDHEPIQGRQYDDKTFTRLNNSLKRSIGTLNCGHSAMPIIMGVNVPQYTDKELEDFRRQNEEGITYEGKHYTLYEATQRQRSLERGVRKLKRKILIDEKLGDTEKLQWDQIRLVRTREEYHCFSKAAGLPEQHERMEIAGFTWKQGKVAEKAVNKGHAPKKAEEIPQLFKSNSEYRTSTGAFDAELAKKDYEIFLTSVPEKHRMFLLQSLNSVEYEEQTLSSGPFGYSPGSDKILFDTSRTDFWGIDFRVANTHELAHRIDCFFVQSHEKQEFSGAIISAKRAIAANPGKFIAFCQANDEEGFLSDVLSAITDGDYRFPFGHDKEYWAIPGNKEREVFANLFSIEVFQDKRKLAFIRENFPELFRAFSKMDY